MTWGGKEGFLTQLEKHGGIKSKALKRKPGLTKWTYEYYRAFRVLTDSRPIGQGSIGRIPFSELKAYMDDQDVIDLDERERFVHMLKALDAVFVKIMNEKLARDRQKAQRQAARRKH